jgi:hypothetical protein
VPSYGERRVFNAGTTGCMGTGVPYAIGAKLARPQAASVAIVGDYAFGAAALEVATAARIGAPVVFVVANNEGIAGHSIQDGMFPPGAPRIATAARPLQKFAGRRRPRRARRSAEPDPTRARPRAGRGGSVVRARRSKATRLSGGVSR